MEHYIKWLVLLVGEKDVHKQIIQAFIPELIDTEHGSKVTPRMPVTVTRTEFDLVDLFGASILMKVNCLLQSLLIII